LERKEIYDVREREGGTGSGGGKGRPNPSTGETPSPTDSKEEREGKKSLELNNGIQKQKSFLLTLGGIVSFQRVVPYRQGK